MSDLRYAVRHLLKSPGFAAVAILTLAIALGVNSAIFPLVNGLVLKPTTPREPDRVVSVFTAKQKADRDYRQFSYREFEALRQPDGPFTEVTAITFGVVGVGDGENVRRALTFFVADNFFEFSGARPAAGRFFTREEAAPNARLPVVVASHGTWQRHGGRPDFVGSTLRVNGRPHTVVGVAPKGFVGISVLFSPDVWLPLGLYGEMAGPFGAAAEERNLADAAHYTLNVSARMQPDATIESTRALLPVLDARLNALLPADTEPRALQITPPSRLSVSTQPSDDSGITIMGTLLLGMAGIVLLIASLNLANLHLARGSARAREIAVRLAVGATRWKIVRQLTIEGLLLGLVGGALGLLLSSWTNALLQASFQTLLASVSFSLSADLQPDLVALAATFGFTLLATLIFSVGPAWRASRANLVSDLKSQAGEPAATGRFNRFFAGRHLLVMGQMALSLVLVFASGLFLRAAWRAGAMDVGFEPRGVVVAATDYSLTTVPREEGHRRVLEALARLRTLPGVEAAGLTNVLPYGNITQGRQVAPAELRDSADPDAPPAGRYANSATISSGYLASLGVSILQGRDFSPEEDREAGGPRVAIIDEGLAREFFPGNDALGRQIRYTNAAAGSADDMTVVGIVSRHRQDLQDEGLATPRVYVPLGQNPTTSTILSVRLDRRDAEAVLAALPMIRRQLAEVDPQMPVLQFEPFTDVMDKCISLWIVRLGAVMFGVFGAIALVLATVGVYGVKAYTVERRTREIGIRMALGADRRRVYALILRQGALQTGFATVAGLGLALLAGQALAQMLYDVSPTDPVSLTAATLLLALASLFACWIPARRATRVDPNTALRSE